MSILEQLQDTLGEEFPVGERLVETITGKKLYEYSVNVRGTVLQFSIPEEDTENPGIVEDFLEHIKAVSVQGY